MSRDGAQWTDSDGTIHTVNSSDNPSNPGGYYHSQVGTDGSKSTSVHTSNGSLYDGPKSGDNSSLVDSPRQD